MTSSVRTGSSRRNGSMESLSLDTVWTVLSPSGPSTFSGPTRRWISSKARGQSSSAPSSSPTRWSVIRPLPSDPAPRCGCACSPCPCSRCPLLARHPRVAGDSHRSAHPDERRRALPQAVDDRLVAGLLVLPPVGVEPAEVATVELGIGPALGEGDQRGRAVRDADRADPLERRAVEEPDEERVAAE